MVEALLVGPPLAVHEVEGGKAQHHGALEACEEDAHEADGGEVVDVALLALVLVHGYAEEVPGVFVRFAVARLLHRHALVGDVVASHLHVVGRDAHTVLVVFLVLVEREVLVDVFHVGRGFIGGAVGLGRVVGVDGVAVGVVDVFVTVENAALLAVVV